MKAALKIRVTNTWKGTSTVSDIILLADSFGADSVPFQTPGVDVDRCHLSASTLTRARLASSSLEGVSQIAFLSKGDFP